MPTARETIMAGPMGGVKPNGGPQFLRTLFNNFCRYARTNWSYVADSPIADYEALLNGTTGVHYRMDCGTLAGAFTNMVQKDLGIQECKVVSVSSPYGFATRAKTSCFDLHIVGNVRTTTGGFKAVRRCVFGAHYFVETPLGFYDPCLTAIYSQKREVMDLQLEPAAYTRGATNPYDEVLFKVMGDPAKLLIRIDGGWMAPPPGFSESYLLINTADLNKKDYQVAFGTPKPSGFWKMSTKSVSQMLRSIGVHHSFRV